MQQGASSRQQLYEWAAYCAKRAKETPNREFQEPELTEIRRGWDRIVTILSECTL